MSSQLEPREFVSVVILNYNKVVDLRRNLAALRQLTTSPGEIIVVDNHSSDGSAEMVKNEFPEVNLIEMAFNSGVAVGRNAGYRVARGQYIVSLDDDSVCPPDTIEKTVSIFTQDLSVGCLAYSVRSVPAMTYDCVVSSVKLGNYHGAGHAFRHSALKQINYLDEKYFFGAEEIDTSLRLMESGYITRYTPEIVIDHHVRKHTGKERYRRMANWIENWGWFYWKYFPVRYAMLFTLRLVVTYLFVAIKHGTWLALFRGIGKITTNLPSVFRVRKVTTPQIVAFYADSNTQPAHFNVSVIVQIVKAICPR